MTPEDAARQCFDYLKPLVKLPEHAYAILGNIDGECGFKFGPDTVGDRATGGAHGLFQWHQARIDFIKNHCGIDVVSSGPVDQLKAAVWEMSDPKSPYRNVWTSLMNTKSIWGGVTVLVRQYEGSRNQMSDIAKRVAYAEKWQVAFPWDEVTK